MKLSILVTLAVMLVLLIVGVYFDVFLRNSFLDSTNKRAQQAFQRLVYNLDNIEAELKKGSVFAQTDERLNASIELIDRYQDKSNYSLELIDEEKKAIASQLLERVKLSLNREFAIYDHEDELIAFAKRQSEGYQMGYVSFIEGKPLVLVRMENELEFHSEILSDNGDIKRLHIRRNQAEAIEKTALLTYSRLDNMVVIKGHQNIFNAASGRVIAHLELSNFLDKDYFTQLSKDMGVQITYSFTSPLPEQALQISKASVENLSVTENGNNYTGVMKKDIYNGPVYFVVTLDKNQINALVKTHRHRFIIFMSLVVAGILLLMRQLIQRSLTRPLNRLMENIKKIEQGNYQVSQSILTGDELEAISQSVNALALAVSDRETSLHQARIKQELIATQLVESETHLRTIIDSEPECIKIINGAGSLVEINPAGLAMFEADSVAQLSGTKLLNTVIPKYRMAFVDMHKRALAGEAVQIEFEVIGLKGGRRWLHVNAVPMQSNGEAVILGVARDITLQKHNQEELRIAATVFDAQEGMMITDANNKILRVNHAFSNITGYSAEEAIGQTPRLLSSGRQDKAFYATMWESINNKGAWAGEIWNQRKNGEVYPEHLTVTAVKDANGIITNYVATLTDITMRKAASDEINNLAFYDPLTRLPNRRLLLDRLNQALATSARSGQRGALLFLDLDHFKTLNDSLGHDVGDLLLQQVSTRLTASVREGDTISRLGGDEFVVLLEDLSEQTIEAAAQTKDISEKILLSLNQPYQLNTHTYHNTPSIGATLFNGHEQATAELLKQADIAMYQSKADGRNTLRFFDPKMQEAINARVDMEQELRKAIEHNQFELHYQIQVGSAGQAIGAEVLIRWQHPERGMISPFNFIPLAEESGLILPIGQWVLDTACAQLKIWQLNPLTQDLVVAVNVSAKQFFQVDFVKQVKATIQRHDINPSLLKLELTESMLVDNINDIITKMNELSNIGIQFSLDDFGTGYSSLQYLKKLPLNQLKIDQSFVRDIATDSSDRAIVRTIITMAHSLDITVIAEGVETAEQQQFLLDNGCLHYQGYLFSKPVPIDAFDALIRQS
jgi:diguanylate cyclase (GGDEF)-like protein/PAS domain S-box-containing protein